MSKNKSVIVFSILVMAAFLLVGCLNSGSPVEDMYVVLEKVVEVEKEFEKQQQPLVELEKKEQELYSQIVELGMKEFDKIVNLSNQAITNVEKRKDLMDKEEVSINKSKQEFEKIVALINKLDDESNLKKQANSLYETMMARYAAHDTLYANYTKGLEYDKELYNLFQKEDLSNKQLEEQIAKINETYKLVMDSNEEFNNQTKKYNKEKVEFYEAAGIELNKE